MASIGIDERIDRCFRSCARSVLPWFLIFYNYVTDIFDRFCIWGSNTLRAIEHAHKDDIWIFFDQNNRPYYAKNDWPGIPDNSLTFNPKTNIFLLHNRIIPIPGVHRFDMITADLVINGKTCDCSSFFLEVGWKGLAAPSLVEMIHLYGILKLGMPYTTEQINSMTLHITDTDGDDYDIPLNCSSAQQRHSTWPIDRKSNT